MEKPTKGKGVALARSQCISGVTILKCIFKVDIYDTDMYDTEDSFPSISCGRNKVTTCTNGNFKYCNATMTINFKGP